MKTSRLEAFSDGVLAIIITIMVLELKVPHATELAALKPMLPVLLSYVLSFIYLGIYWNNHHHLFQAAKEVSGGILWANLHLLFWLSLFPFTTGWMGENHLASTPTAVYGFVLLMAAIAYYILQRTIIAKEGRDSLIRVGRWPRLERETFAGSLPHRYSARVRELMDCRRALRVWRASLVDSRPSDRTGNRKAREVSSRKSEIRELLTASRKRLACHTRFTRC